MSQKEEQLHEDQILPFRLENAPVRGRIGRFDQAINEILSAHQYPIPVARFLSETLCLAAILASSLKLKGKLILQIQSDGPVHLLVVDVTADGAMRGYASFDEKKLAKLPEETTLKQLAGKGHMAITLDQGGKGQRYQGMVALPEDNLASGVMDYFAASEQLPTFISISAVQNYNLQTEDGSANPTWRVGGLFIQQLPFASLGAQGKYQGTLAKNQFLEDWDRSVILAKTIEAGELADETLPLSDLAFRLFHEEGVRIYEPSFVLASCSCSREKLLKLLAQFDHQTLSEMVDETTSKIKVDCEFCASHYEFSLAEIRIA